MLRYIGRQSRLPLCTSCAAQPPFALSTSTFKFEIWEGLLAPEAPPRRRPPHHSTGATPPQASFSFFQHLIQASTIYSLIH